MIARTIHNAIPEKQLEKDIFKSYITSKNKINKKIKIIDIDSIPILHN